VKNIDIFIEIRYEHEWPYCFKVVFYGKPQGPYKFISPIRERPIFPTGKVDFIRRMQEFIKFWEVHPVPFGLFKENLIKEVKEILADSKQYIGTSLKWNPGISILERQAEIQKYSVTVKENEQGDPYFEIGKDNVNKDNFLFMAKFFLESGIKLIAENKEIRDKLELTLEAKGIPWEKGDIMHHVEKTFGPRTSNFFTTDEIIKNLKEEGIDITVAIIRSYVHLGLIPKPKRKPKGKRRPNIYHHETVDKIKKIRFLHKEKKYQLKEINDELIRKEFPIMDVERVDEFIKQMEERMEQIEEFSQ